MGMVADLWVAGLVVRGVELAVEADVADVHALCMDTNTHHSQVAGAPTVVEQHRCCGMCM